MNYDFANLCLQNHSVNWKTDEDIWFFLHCFWNRSKLDDTEKQFCNHSVQYLYIPPKPKRCQVLEEVNFSYTNCCPSDEFDVLMLQRFWEKKKESWKLEEFKNYYISLTKAERQEITQEIIKQEEMYSMVTRDFKIISQEEYNHLKMNWEIKEQTTIFIFLFLILLVFLKSFRKYFLRKG